MDSHRIDTHKCLNKKPNAKSVKSKDCFSKIEESLFDFQKESFGWKIE